MFGLEKYFRVLVDWEHCLAPVIVRQTPWTTHQIMYVMGAVEIVAALAPARLAVVFEPAPFSALRTGGEG